LIFKREKTKNRSSLSITVSNCSVLAVAVSLPTTISKIRHSYLLKNYTLVTAILSSMFSAIARTASCLVLVHIGIFIPADIEFRSKTSAQCSRTFLDFIVKRSIKSNATMEAAEKTVIIGSNEK